MLTLPRLFPYQKALLARTERDVFCVSATQVGKTFAMACWLLASMWCPRRPFPWWWVAPTYMQLDQGLETVSSLASSAGILDLSRCKKTPFPKLVLINGNKAEFRSWDKPQNLQGRTIAGGVVDEAGLLTDEAQAAISTRRSATLGPLRYIGNPGMKTGQFRRLMASAEDSQPGVCGVARWTWEDRLAALEAISPQRAREYRAFIESERRSMAEYEFERLYEAKWTEDRDAWILASYVDTATEGALLESGAEGARYSTGVDVGEVGDYFVASSIGRASMRLDGMMRFRGKPAPEQADALKEHLARFPGPCVIELNGPGRQLYGTLAAEGVDVLGFDTTHESKAVLVNSLRSGIQEGVLTLAEAPPLQHELKVFRYERVISGAALTSYRYQAPKGEHDDCVMSLGLSWWGLMHAPHAGLMEFMRMQAEGKGARS